MASVENGFGGGTVTPIEARTGARRTIFDRSGWAPQQVAVTHDVVWVFFGSRDRNRVGRAGLIEGDRAHLCERFEVGAAPDQDPGPGGARDRRDHGGRHRHDQPAGAGDDKHDERAVNPLACARTGERRQHGDDQSEREHRRRVDGAEAVGEALAAALRRLRLLDLADDPRERRVGVALADPELECAETVYGPAEHRRSRTDLDRDRTHR